MAPEEGDVWEGGGRRYRMEKVVGNGAFGVVWRAREEGNSNELVAIKKVRGLTLMARGLSRLRRPSIPARRCCRAQPETAAPSPAPRAPRPFRSPAARLSARHEPAALVFSARTHFASL